VTSGFFCITNKLSQISATINLRHIAAATSRGTSTSGSPPVDDENDNDDDVNDNDRLHDDVLYRTI